MTARTISHAPAWGEHDPTLLGSGRRPPPSFPIDALKAFWSEWVQAEARKASAPVDYVAASLLAATAAAMANVRWPSTSGGWTEPPLLWVGLVGNPSSGKSPSIDPAMALLTAVEEKIAKGFEEKLAEHEAEKRAAKARRQIWEEKVKVAAEKSETPPPLPDDCRAPEVPERPRIRVSDTTIEKLGALAASLPRGLLMVRDELAGWFGNFDRYGGNGGDRAFFIEAYGGRSYTIDRVKHPVPIKIAHLSVGLLGGVQPDKLHSILEQADDGLASRILWAWPEPLPTIKLARRIDHDPRARDAFSRLAGLWLGTDEAGRPEPVPICLSADALDVLEEFAQHILPRTGEATGLVASALGKARGHVLRISLVLEYLWWASEGGSEPVEIGRRAVEQAVRLVSSYFLVMAERVIGDAAIPLEERRAMVLVRWLRSTGVPTFNAREARRKISGPLRNAKDMQAACEVLEEAGLIRSIASRAGEKPGQQTKDYEVNPAVMRPT
jgi:Protein of unknown function (DUF3987)